MTGAELDTLLRRMAEAIVARERDDAPEVGLIGIETRGVPLAKRLAQHLKALRDRPVEVGALSIRFYRSDLSRIAPQPQVNRIQIPFEIDGRGLILVDDVLYTGYTIHTAVAALLELGQPAFIHLAVLIDRGWRTLPIEADYIGQTVPTAAHEVVEVKVAEVDGEQRVLLVNQDEIQARKPGPGLD